MLSRSTVKSEVLLQTSSPHILWMPRHLPYVIGIYVKDKSFQNVSLLLGYALVSVRRTAESGLLL